MQYDRTLIYISFIGLSLGVLLATFLSWSEMTFFSMHPLLLPIFFLLGVLLFLIVVKDNLPLSTGIKLVFVIAYSFLANLIHVVLLYPILTGDLAYHLAVERNWDKFGIHYFLLLPLEAHISQIQGFFNRLYIYQRGAAQYGLVVSLTKMFRVDLFWINALLIGVLWSFFVPIIAFKVSKTLRASNRTSLLTAILTASLPILMLWSWKSAGITFGLFFLFTAIYFLLKSFSNNTKRKYTFLALLASTVSVLCHPMTGITSFSLLLLAFGIKNYYTPRRSSFSIRARLPNLFLSFFIVALALPSMSVLLQLVYPTYSQFSLQKILSIDAYHLIFAEYTDYTTISVLTYLSTTVLAIIGMTMSKPGEKEKGPRLFLIVAFTALVLQYRIFYYFIENPLFGIHRLYALEPFFITPFIAIAIDRFLKTQRNSPPKLCSPKSSSKQKSMFRAIFPSKEVLPTLLICISLSALLTQGHLSSFENDVHEPYSIVSPFSMKAATLIHEEYLRNHERYVVISDPITQHAGLALVGRYNVEELYLEQTENRELFIEALRQTSRQTLLKAAAINNASLVYLTIFRYYVKLFAGSQADFDEILNLYSKMLEKVAVLGDGERQTAVLRLRIPEEPYTGIGPTVTVLKDSQQFQLNTTYSYLFSDDTEYTLNLTGSTEYNITDWPMHWSYESIFPRLSSTSIDANTWINFTGSPNDIYTIKWVANELFPNVIWKDDSFLHGWAFIGRYTLTTHSFTSDGNVVADSLSGKPEDPANYQKNLPSLQNCTSLLIRLKGATNSKFMIQIWDDISEGWEGRAFLAGWLVPPTEYTTIIFPLPSNRTLTLFWLTVLTTDGKLTTINWDYVMITK